MGAACKSWGTKNPSPFVKRQIAGDQGGAALVTLTEDLEQELSAGSVHSEEERFAELQKMAQRLGALFNGFPGVLSIPSIDAQGNLGANCTIFGQRIFGFWSTSAQMLTFMRIISPSDPSTFQVYTGYLMQPQPGSGFLVSLAGSFEAFRGGGGVAQRPLYGWDAQRRTG